MQLEADPISPGFEVDTVHPENMMLDCHPLQILK